MTVRLAPWQYVYSVYAAIVFIAYLLIVFPLVILAIPFGRIRGGHFLYRLCKLWADVAFVFWGMRHRNQFDFQPDPSKAYVFVFNHTSYMDIPVIMKSIRKQPFRVLGKAEMAKIPIFGLLYRLCVIMVRRDSPEHRAASVQELTWFLKQGISVVIAPEGTFNMSNQPLKSFYDGAFRVAITTQTPIVPMLFLDALDRMHYDSVFAMTPGKSRTVFLPPVSVEGLTEDDIPALRDHVYQVMDAGLRAHHVSWIQATENLPAR